MNKKSPTVVFFGNEQIATGTVSKAKTLTKLINNGYKICGVVVNNTKTNRRNTTLTDTIIVAEQNNIPVITNPTNSFLLHFIQQKKPDVGILVSYGNIISKSIINAIPNGILNIHPSLLPLNRGSTPIENYILQGSKKTGVTIIKLVPKMDAGPIVTQKEIKLNGKESKQQIVDELLEIGSTEIIKTLPILIGSKIKSIQQNESLATYDNKIFKDDGIINPNKPATQIEREVRAYLGWPGSRLQMHNLWLTVTKADVSNIFVPKGYLKFIDGQLLYGCKDGSLNIKELKPAGKKEMSASAFYNGYAHLLNN